MGCFSSLSCSMFLCTTLLLQCLSCQHTAIIMFMLYACIFNQSGNQCGSCSDGFVRSQLVWIYTVFKIEYIQAQPEKGLCKWNMYVLNLTKLLIRSRLITSYVLSFCLSIRTDTVNHLYEC